MIINPERFAARHRLICRQAEQEFARRQADRRRHTLEAEVRSLAADVDFFVKRGGTSKAEVLAIKAAHLGIKLAGPLQNDGTRQVSVD